MFCKLVVSVACSKNQCSVCDCSMEPELLTRRGCRMGQGALQLERMFYSVSLVLNVNLAGDSYV